MPRHGCYGWGVLAGIVLMRKFILWIVLAAVLGAAAGAGSLWAYNKRYGQAEHAADLSKEKIDEAISNLRIDSDGDVGQVWFDYNFVRGGYRENWGKESWQMVRTNDGWRIAGVVWSQELNPVPPPSAEVQ